MYSLPSSIFPTVDVGSAREGSIVQYVTPAAVPAEAAAAGDAFKMPDVDDDVAVAPNWIQIPHEGPSVATSMCGQVCNLAFDHLTLRKYSLTKFTSSGNKWKVGSNFSKQPNSWQSWTTLTLKEAFRNGQADGGAEADEEVEEGGGIFGSICQFRLCFSNSCINQPAFTRKKIQSTEHSKASFAKVCP